MEFNAFTVVIFQKRFASRPLEFNYGAQTPDNAKYSYQYRGQQVRQ